MARDRKSSHRRRANAQPARARPKPAPGRPSDGAKPPPVAPQPDLPVDAGALDPPPVGDSVVGEPVAPEPVAGEPVAREPVVGGPVVGGPALGHGSDLPLVDDVSVDAAAPGLPDADSATLEDPAVDDPELGHATVDDDVLVGDESVIAALEPAELPVGAVPIDPPTLPPLVGPDGAEGDVTGEYASTRDRLAANRLDESDEILPAARRGGRPPAKVGGNKVMSFLRASWAELQRVQWPDRRQVGQATAVVLGFVVVAGGFLGLADLLGSDLVNAIL